MKRIVGIVLFCLIASQSIGQDKERPKQPNLPGDIVFDFGFSVWDQGIDQFPTKWFGSNSFGVRYNRRVELSKNFSLYGGVGFSFDKMAFDDRYTWMRDGAMVGVDSIPSSVGISILKNKLATTYFDVPVEFRIYPLGTVDGEGWFIGLGGFGGVRLGSHTKLKYQTADEKLKEKLYGDFDLARFRYGLQARFGFNSFHVFYKMHLNNSFNSDLYQGSGNPKMSTFGVSFSGF